jgi:hypothetical protein
MWAYRLERHAAIHKRADWFLFAVACLLYGIIFAGVAVNFPQGLTVALVWLAVFAVPLAVWLYRQPDPLAEAPRSDLLRRLLWRPCQLFSPGRSLVLQYYLMSYTIALGIIIVYIIIFGFKDRASAGIPLK